MRIKRIEVGAEDVTVQLPLPEPPAVNAVVRAANANLELERKMGVILLPDSGSPIFTCEPGFFT